MTFKIKEEIPKTNQMAMFFTFLMKLLNMLQILLLKESMITNCINRSLSFLDNIPYWIFCESYKITKNCYFYGLIYYKCISGSLKRFSESIVYWKCGELAHCIVLIIDNFPNIIPVKPSRACIITDGYTSKT